MGSKRFYQHFALHLLRPPQRYRRLPPECRRIVHATTRHACQRANLDFLLNNLEVLRSVFISAKRHAQEAFHIDHRAARPHSPEVPACGVCVQQHRPCHYQSSQRAKRSGCLRASCRKPLEAFDPNRSTSVPISITALVVATDQWECESDRPLGCRT